MLSGSVHSHSCGLRLCLICCLAQIVTQKEAFHILWYQTVQKGHCPVCQVQLIVPVGLHHQRNVCCKTWHKKPGTEVCIGCHTLYWQFYQQWTDESLCVAPTCCLHTVLPGIVCESGDIAVKYHLCCNCSHPSWSYSSVNLVCTPFDRVFLTVLSCHISWYDMSVPCWSLICGNVGQYQLNSNIGVCVCMRVCLLNMKLCLLQFYRNL